MPDFASLARSGAQKGRFQFFGIAAAAVLATLLSGCIIPNADYPDKQEFNDPHRSLVFMFIHYDPGDIEAWHAHLRHADGKGDVSLVWVDDLKHMGGQCVLYMGALPSGTYDFIALTTDHATYRFPKGPGDDYHMRVGKRREIYMLGKFALHTSTTKAGEEGDSFILKPTRGCPGNKVAYRIALHTKYWKDWLAGSHWRKVMEARAR